MMQWKYWPVCHQGKPSWPLTANTSFWNASTETNYKWKQPSDPILLSKQIQEIQSVKPQLWGFMIISLLRIKEHLNTKTCIYLFTGPSGWSPIASRVPSSITSSNLLSNFDSRTSSTCKHKKVHKSEKVISSSLKYGYTMFNITY